MRNKVLIVMGSDSDFPIMKACISTLVEFNVAYEAKVCSAHRTPDQAIRLARGAAEQGFGVIIAAAGLAAHLPGILSACTTLPVIGVPIKAGALAGTDALYSIVQMPSGVPVATVAIDGAENAAILAVEILALQDERLAQRLLDHKTKMIESVQARQQNLEAKLHDLH
ncbi:MAG: 5-(carboxyamino)imidazole ribonucleotide mutase [Saccharofermentanales bacterium]|jgi:5-(carboxyamino)imidazole ribonucleotide mutase|nr:5-(carboxyamino)imidazole ribonucleotide mutase [Clostridiaceae bacterium]